MKTDLLYRQSNDGAIIITGVTGNPKKIIIPSEIDGKKITHIGDGAFRGNQLTQVEIPNSVTHIGSGAFRGNQLTQVEIPNSVTHIGDGAFRGNQLTQVEIPNSVTHIGSGAFDGNQLTQVEIPNSVTHIGDWAFDGNQLTQVEIPNSVTHIGSGAFRGNQLTQVEIPNSVTHIGSGAFDGSVDIIQSNHKIKMIDGIATVIRRKTKIDYFEVFVGQFFNTKRDCFVAKRDEYFAHADTIKQAIKDVNFKFLQENANVEDIVKEVKQSGRMSIAQFRLITGACSAGCANFLNEHKVIESELPLDKALALVKGAFGWSKIKEHFF